VRRALALALPWEDIRKEQLLPAPTLVYPIPEYPKMEGMTKPDNAEAKRLLGEAGYPDGKDIPELVLRITPSTEAARVAEIMTKAWTETLSLNVRVDVVPYDMYFDSMKKDDYVVGSSTWIGDFADPYTFLQMWRTDSNLNDAKFNDPEFENLVDRSLVEEGSTRYKTLAEAEKLLLDWGVVLPISYTPALNIIDTDEIDGWYQNPLDIHPLKYLSYAAYRPLPGVALVQP
jgi:peptide/nickel transport system substrate-binding protein/oligopeptide transport system substrate-binding protein